MKEEDVIRIFNEGFEQIVLPHILELKTDIQKLRETTSRIEHRQEAERGYWIDTTFA